MEKKRIKLEPVGPMLLDFPAIVIEEILLNLNLRDRKIIRLTCKRLYELCNSSRICMKEAIIWREIDTSAVKMQPALLKIGRSLYNLVIDCGDRAIDNLQKSRILQFLKENGAKMRSLVIKKTYFTEALLEPIIVSCEGLQSLTLSFTTRNKRGSSPSDYFTIEPSTITRPTVTHLELTLHQHQPSKYFHRMLSVFPNVKQLKIEMEQSNRDNYIQNFAQLDGQTALECSTIFDDIIKCGNNLTSLHLNIPLSQLIAKTSQFCEALSSLKDLSIRFNGGSTLNEAEKLYSCFSNLTSLELCGHRSFQLKHVLENTQLNSLKIFPHSYYPTVLNGESFKALVSSNLKILRLGAYQIEGVPITGFDSPLEANTTVTDLHLSFLSGNLAAQGQLFMMYFRGLVHLTVQSSTDAILQHIFQYQQNLRSLVLGMCNTCSKDGFCGSRDGRFKYSINDLQKLKHLSISMIYLEFIASDEFRSVFNPPLLEYLDIDCFSPPAEDYHGRIAKIRPELYENLTHLRALRIKDIAMPSRETISSLFTKLKHLNYLRFDLDTDDEDTKAVTFINTKEFSININDYKYAYTLGHFYYDTELDRMVTLNRGLRKRICYPKISSYVIDWMKA